MDDVADDHASSITARRTMRAAADELLATVLGNEKLIDHLVATEIARRIDGGDLIETKTLTLGAGAQVIAKADYEALTTRMAELELAIHEAQVCLDDGQPVEALRYLDSVRPPHDDEDDAEAGDEPEPEPEPDEATDTEPAEPVASGRPRSKVQVRRPSPAGKASKRGDGTKVDTDDEGKPVGMPDGSHDRHHCTAPNCKDRNVPGEQAQLSFIRFRQILCRDDMIGWQPSKADEPEGDAEQPEADVA